MPRAPANKNIPAKPTYLCGFQYLKQYKIPYKTLFRCRESGRTVGSSRVAMIVE